MSRLPRTVFSAATPFVDERALRRVSHQERKRSPPAFIIRRQRIYTFVDIRQAEHAFVGCVVGDATVEPSEALCSDPSRGGELRALLRRVLFKICGSKGLLYDPQQRCWYLAHLAVGLDFEQAETRAWRLSMEIVRRTGARAAFPHRAVLPHPDDDATRHLRFWRDLLSENTFKLVKTFGREALVVETRLGEDALLPELP